MHTLKKDLKQPNFMSQESRTEPKVNKKREITKIRVEISKIKTRTAGRSTNWNQDCREKSITSGMQMTPPLWKKVKRN